MNKPAKWIAVAAGLAGASGVLFGAFGAHFLPPFLEGQSSDPEFLAKRIAQFDTGARYHLIHAVALLAMSLVRTSKDRLRSITAILFAIGIVFFSGSLYVLVLTNSPWLGAITPIGGTLWIVAWCLSIFCARIDP